MAENTDTAVRQSDEILISTDGPVGIVQMNRPEALNALSFSVLEAIGTAMEDFDRDPGIRCMVLAGSQKVFASGADIKELEESTLQGFILKRRMLLWDRIRHVSKPVIAAVSGFALGGGCEIAMMCDIIVASETAVFSQPEINLGVIPGAGGTQRLIKAVGKPVAMDMILTGRRMKAKEALERGLVSRVVPAESYLEEAKKLAHQIAKKAPIAAVLAKEGVARALDMDLATGLDYERKLFYLLWGTEDQKEGMQAFREKRTPEFKGN